MATRREYVTPDETVVATMVDRIVEGFDPERIVLFGSVARGEVHRYSDVDLLVVMPDGTDRHEAAVAMHRAVSGMLTAKDIVVTTPDEIARRGHVNGSVLREALREGIVVHDRHRALATASWGSSGKGE
jgi:predicted nucleotidyltransferase